MARRGDRLREHILWRAKEVFLETGFERASMDVVAARAETSKRSLYAHFESKEKLFLAVIEFVRGLFFERLRRPGDYSDRPEEAVALFLGRYLEILLYDGSVRMCRVFAAEATRFREGATQHYDVLFTEVHRRLRGYLDATFALPPGGGDEAARKLLGLTLYPRFPRALFGVDPLAEKFGEEGLSPDFDLSAIRAAVADVLGPLRKL